MSRNSDTIMPDPIPPFEKRFIKFAGKHFRYVKISGTFRQSLVLFLVPTKCERVAEARLNLAR